MDQTKRSNIRLNKKPLVGIIMGSSSDLNIMSQAAEILNFFGIEYEITVVSAHRTPNRMFSYAQKAQERGLKIIIAGAGGSAHLPGMVASISTLPVIGVPINSGNSLDGWDSLLSIVQMPQGIPVATVAVDGAGNAGILAAQMLALSSNSLSKKLAAHKKALEDKVLSSISKIEKNITYSKNNPDELLQPRK
jgi:5-(carboxyamino)imidazole ribonucleotide mutase